MGVFALVTVYVRHDGQITEHQIAGEPLTPGLVITPAVHEGGFTGGWTITHTSSGWSVTRSNVCLPCLRRATEALVESGVDWTRDREAVIGDPDAATASEEFAHKTGNCGGPDCVSALIEAGF